MNFCPLKCFLCGLLCCLFAQLKAQHFPIPDEDESELPKEKTNFCRPGVANQSRGRGILLERRITGQQYQAPDIGDIDGANASEIGQMERLKAKIKIPLVNAPSLKVLAGYEYMRETFHFNRIGHYNEAVFSSLHDNPLHTNKYSLYITKSFNGKYYGGLRLRTSYRGDHEKAIAFDSRYATYSGLLAFGMKASEDLEYGVGLTFGRNFFRTQVLPFGIYNQTFNDKWGIETVLPVQIMGRYNFSPTHLLLFGVEYQSKSYSIDVYERGGEELAVPHYFRRAEIAFKATYDKHLFSWIWFTAEAGYQLPLESRFDNTQDPSMNFRTRTSPQPFFSFGLFVTPSRDCIK